jgi:hypothetical protein
MSGEEIMIMTIKWRAAWCRTAILGLLVALLGSFPNSGFAACTNDAGAAQNASNFLSNPSSLLNGPNGPRSPSEISADVRDFVAANPQALAAVITLLKDKNLGLSVDQQKAIGTGMGLAAGVCIRPDPTFAAEIQTQLAATDSADAKTAYAAVTGNQLIGTVGGGAGGGAGSAGAVGGQTSPFFVPSGTSSFQAFTSNSVSNTPTNFFNGGAGGAGGSSTSSTTNVVCVVSSTCP